MKFYHFSETPYPHLPDLDTVDSVRVTLPTSLIDPSRLVSLWDRYIAEWVAADEAGLNIMLNEHHSTATCMNTAAPVVAGALSRATRDARILILGNPVANRKDPVRVAEEMALLDVLSHGRIDAGFVRGVPYEVSAVNSNPTGMNERMWEAIDLIEAAWVGRDGPFNWEGEYFHHRQVNIWPRPIQEPTPPVWVTTLNPRSVRRIAERKYVVATFLTGHEGARPVFQAYRDYWAEQGSPSVDVDRFAYMGLVYVGRTDSEGRDGARELLWYLTSNKVAEQFVYPPGYVPAKPRAAVLQGAASPFGHPAGDIDDMIDKGIVFAGDAATVRAQIARFEENVGGLGHLMLMGQAGFMDHDTTLRGITNFASGVQPHFV